MAFQGVLPITPCGLQSRVVPFAPLRSSPARRVRCIRSEALKKPVDASLPVTLGGLLLSGQAWADDVVEQIQGADLPSSLPSAEEIVEKVPQTGGGILDLFTDNPIIIVGVLFLAAIPLALNFLGGGALGVKQVNAAGALEGLESDPSTVLVDIRSKQEAKEQGSPNLSSVKKRAVVLPFTRLVSGGEIEEIEGFADSFGKLKQIKPDSSIILLDSYGQEAPKAAKQLAKLAGRVYYVKDGAVGATGWKESGQPWREPVKSLLNLDGLADDFRDQPTLAKAGVAAGAIGVAAALLFQEAGTALELAAVAAAGAFALPLFTRGSTDVGDGTQKRQVKQFVAGAEKDAEKAASKVVGKAQKAAASATGKAEKAAPATSGKVERAAAAVTGKAEKAASAAAGKAEKAAPKLSRNGKQLTKQADKLTDADVSAKAKAAAEKVQETFGKDVGAKAKSAASSLQEAVEEVVEKPGEAVKDVEKTVEKAGSKVEAAATDASKAASQNATEARTWIDNWRKENQ